MENLLRQSCKDTEKWKKTFGSQFWHYLSVNYIYIYIFIFFFSVSSKKRFLSLCLGLQPGLRALLQLSRTLLKKESWQQFPDIPFQRITFTWMFVNSKYKEKVAKSSNHSKIKWKFVHTVVLDQLLPCWISIHEFQIMRKLLKVNLHMKLKFII